MTINFFYVHDFNYTKEAWDILEMIYKVSSSIDQERMNTRDKEDKCFIHKCIFKYRNIGNNVRTFATNKYLRIKNWNQKHDPILKS